MKHGRGYRVRLPYFDANGKRQFESRQVNREPGESDSELKARAEGVGAEMVLARNQGSLRAGRAQTVDEYAEMWLRSIQRDVAPFTHRNYGVVVNRHISPALGHIRLRDLGPSQVRDFFSNLRDAGLAPSTVAQVRSVLRNLLYRAVEDDLIIRNPISRTKPPKPGPRDVPTLTREQGRSLVREAAKGRLLAPVVLALFCGLRREEAVGLRWRDLDLDKGEAAIVQTLQRHTGQGVKPYDTKTTGSFRAVPVPPTAVAHLRKWRTRQREERLAAGPAWRDTGEGYVCTRLDGVPLEPDEVSKGFRELADLLGLLVTFHGLRHTFATLALQGGADIRWVQAVLGHKTAAFTLGQYAHVTAASLQETSRRVDEAVWGGGGGEV
jgi:integrase